LFVLWRDKEMPLQHFQGYNDSKVEPNSVGNFWFDNPSVFNKSEGFSAVIITEPNKWKKMPLNVQKSEMKYRVGENMPQDQQWKKWYQYSFAGHEEKQKDEYHTGNRLSLDELEIKISRGTKFKADRMLESIRRAKKAVESDNIPVPSDESKLRIDLESFLNREMGQDEGEKRKTEIDVSDLKILQQLESFYSWLIELPIIEDNEVEDITK